MSEDDDELSNNYAVRNYDRESMLRKNFVNLDDQVLADHFARGDLRRSGSTLLLYLAEEIFHRVFIS
jgi:hypothetical protein